MVKIKLSQWGKKTSRIFRIIICEARSKRNGKAIETIGVWDPTSKPPSLKIDQKRLNFWLSQGVQMTDKVRKLISKK